MQLPTREEIKFWLKSQGKTRGELAEYCNVAATTISQWLSTKDIPIKQHYAIARLMKPKQFIAEQTDLNNLNIGFSDEELEEIEKASRLVGASTIKEFIKKSVIARMQEEQEPPTIHAAAGEAITNEIPDNAKPNAKGLFFTVVNGESMQPTLQNGQKVEMLHVSKWRVPYPKKGEIYLVRVADSNDFMIKRYSTRLATKEEIAADKNYVYYSRETGEGKVMVLLSDNPKFDEIIIDKDAYFIGWLNQKQN